jgi:predicted lactoylglutathione lyase
MNARISCITLPVDNVKKSLAFYRDGLGLTTERIAEGDDHVAMFLPGDLCLVLILREEFTQFTKLSNQEDAARGASEYIFSYFAASRDEVDATLKRVEAAAGLVPGQAKEQPWGYAGLFKDPDGHLWEVMWNHHLTSES